MRLGADRDAVESHRRQDAQVHQDLDIRRYCTHHRRYQEHRAHRDAQEWPGRGERGLDKSADQALEHRAERQLERQDEEQEHPA